MCRCATYNYFHPSYLREWTISLWTRRWYFMITIHNRMPKPCVTIYSIPCVSLCPYTWSLHQSRYSLLKLIMEVARVKEYFNPEVCNAPLSSGDDRSIISIIVAFISIFTKQISVHFLIFSDLYHYTQFESMLRIKISAKGLSVG